MKSGDRSCNVINLPPNASYPLYLALMAAEIKKTHGEEISIEDQTRTDLILIQTDDATIKVEGVLNICQDYSAATLMHISSEQFEKLETGDIIFVDNPALVTNKINSKYDILICFREENLHARGIPVN